jgi:hypothetical protein
VQRGFCIYVLEPLRVLMSFNMKSPPRSFRLSYLVVFVLFVNVVILIRDFLSCSFWTVDYGAGNGTLGVSWLLRA